MNVIAKEIAAQADDSECYSTDLWRICNHQRDGDAVTNEQLSSKEGIKHCCTTKGWKLQCEFEDRSKEWIALSNLKESYPVQLAQYAVANNIDDEPAFKWWVPYTLRKRDVIPAEANNPCANSLAVRTWTLSAGLGSKIHHRSPK